MLKLQTSVLDRHTVCCLLYAPFILYDMQSYKKINKNVTTN